MTNCFSKLLLCFLFSLSALIAAAQKNERNYRQQFSLITENDSYTLKIIDRYYTSGIGLRYSKALVETEKKKKLLNLELGQSIYTAYDTRKSYYYRSLDRPYTGFLFLKGGLSYLYRNENHFRWNVIAGVSGEAAQGQEVQHIIHRLLGFKPAYGWEVQLRSDFGINAQATYHHALVKQQSSKHFDAFFVSDAMLGTTFTKASAGALFRIGALEPSYNSAFWNGRIHTNVATPSRHHELFFYFEPSIIAQAYNATIQGGLFSDQEGRYTSSIEPFIYQHKFGAMYARHRWTAQLGYTYRTREAKTMIGKEVFGTIVLGYRF